MKRSAFFFSLISALSLFCVASSLSPEKSSPQKLPPIKGNLPMPVTNVFLHLNAAPFHDFLVDRLKICMRDKDNETMLNDAKIAVRVFPKDPIWHYNLACGYACTGDLDAAYRTLVKSAYLGFSDLDTLLRDEDLIDLRNNPDFDTILALIQNNAKNPELNPNIPHPLSPFAATNVTPRNTVWNGNEALFSVLLSPLPPLSSRPPSSKLPGQTGDALRKWIAEGTAAGNFGDIYDNHDRGHSRLETGYFPGLISTRYAPEVIAENLDTGSSIFTFSGIPTIGNSSTARTVGPYWGSCARIMQNHHIKALFAQYLSNVLYVYPQHNDYREDLHGDVFPARTPYLLISPASSWSDKPILAALASALAALRPEVKKTLADNGYIAPTLQYLIRSSQTNVINRADYLTAAAHPVVFNPETIDTLKLVTLAHEIQTNSLPPIAFLEINSEKKIASPSSDRRPEKWFVSPCSLAFVWRAHDYSRQITMRACNPFFIGEKNNDSAPKTKFHWFIGQGDPNRIKIEPLNDDASLVQITIQYHEPGYMTDFHIRSSRVDVICVADDGTNFSPPSFVTWYFPPNEKRIYQNEKLISIDYSGTTNYCDPDVVSPIKSIN